MVRLEPVADEQGEITSRGWKRDGNPWPLIDVDGAIASGRPVKDRGGEEREGTDLVLGLEVIGEVGVRRDRTVGTENPILPRILPLLDPIPSTTYQHSDQITNT